MKTKPLVSILITNYNKKKYLNRCLSSCEKQTYTNKEILLHDDHSKDGSLEIIKKFKNIKLVVNKKKRNKSNPLNQAKAILRIFKLCKGKIIFLLDADDYFKKNKLHEIVKKFKSNSKLDFIQDTPIFLNKKKEYKFKNKNSKSTIWPRFYPTSTIAIKRNFFLEIQKILNTNKFPNLEIDARICIYTFIKKKFNITKKKYTFYSDDNFGISSKYKKFSVGWWKKRKEAYQFMFNIMKKKKINFKKGLDYYITNFLVDLY
tara:strand:+ start:162 stop:941 length:780 start_codon:yes stop_codon:yes gene_type:complete